MRKVYLSNTDPDKALEKLISEVNFDIIEEIIEPCKASGRVTSRAVYASQSSPGFNASAMDGVAVITESTFGADERKPKKLILNKDFIYVDTGDLIKEPYNAVIMIEDIQKNSEDSIVIIKPASPWQHIRPMGEDIIVNEMIVPANHQIRAVDMGALLSGGVMSVHVYKRPIVGILPTGSEIIEPGVKPKDGEITESNSRVFEALTTEYGGIAKRYPIQSDNYDLLKKCIEQMVDDTDIIVVNAGSSAGSEDFTAPVIAELGKVLVHGIATKPGKPAILGIIKGKPVIGIPGYPVSAYYVFETFVKPLIYMFQGTMPVPDKTVEAIVSKRIVSSLKHKEFVPVKLGSVDGRVIATPLNRGAGVTMSLVRADGLLIIDKNSEGFEAGENACINLLRSLDHIENTIVSIGSHDLIMDIIASDMQKTGGKYFLSSSHVGSMGGIMAIKRGEAHLAPVHLLDPKTGIYNISYVQKYLPGKEMALIKGIKRVQGLIVQKGNPKNIKTIKDLTKKGISFVNRQKGAGTRFLLDYLIETEKISPEDIKGYEREVSTHMAVAASVLSKSADVGVGVYSAAKALDLDFIPVGNEDYDFLIETKLLVDNKVCKFIEILTSDKLKKQLAELGGYDTAGAGEIIYINGES